jgi:hypothetical protein
MGSFASAVMRLVGPFHCSGSRSASLGFEFRPARSVSGSGVLSMDSVGTTPNTQSNHTARH